MSEWLVNGRFLTRAMTGVDRFAREITRGLPAWCPDGMRVLVPGAGALADGPGEPRVHRVGRRSGMAWEQFELSGAAGDLPLLNLCNMGPLLRRRQWVVVHDAATFDNPDNYSRAFRAWYAVALRALAARSQGLATVSRFSAGQLMRHLGLKAGQIDVVPEGGEHILQTAADMDWFRETGLQRDGYVLAVGSQSANKNVAAVVQAMSDPALQHIRLVAAGGANRQVFSAATPPEPGGMTKQLLRTGYVSDGQLRALYENALCFVFPSHYEGFGLPPLEAMNCDCPVVISDIPPLLEVCGDAALVCDPHKPASLAAQIKRLTASPALREELRAAGRLRAGQFNWQRAAQLAADSVRSRLAD